MNRFFQLVALLYFVSAAGVVVFGYGTVWTFGRCGLPVDPRTGASTFGDEPVVVLVPACVLVVVTLLLIPVMRRRTRLLRELEYWRRVNPLNLRREKD